MEFVDNHRRSLLNTFTSDNLNRYSENRRNDGWIESMFASKNSYLIPIHLSKVLLTENNSLPVFINSEKKQLIRNQKLDLIFLGEIEGNYFFAFDTLKLDKNLNADIEKLGIYSELRAAAPLLSKDHITILSLARSMVYWNHTHKFCGICGNQTILQDSGFKRICTNTKCSAEHFPRTDPAIIVLVSKGEKCLLARQAKWRKNQYATVAGFVEPGETLEQAVAREVKEETGVVLDKIYYHSSQPWPFPATIMLGFTAEAASEEIVLGDHELEDAKWFSREEIITNVREGKLLFPSRISISFKLVEFWFNQGNHGKLSDHISE